MDLLEPGGDEAVKGGVVQLDGFREARLADEAGIEEDHVEPLQPILTREGLHGMGAGAGLGAAPATAARQMAKTMIGTTVRMAVYPSW